jgi:2-amino-4-hydroxy-6-hydroxymethyldihydropteridine diphosphokinase
MSERELHLVYIGLGSNLGDGTQNLRTALDALAVSAGRVVAISPMVSSEPWGFDSPHRFTNAVAALETTLSPEELLSTTQEIERRMGRTERRKPGEPYEDRIIDLDLLLYDDLHCQTLTLTLPHPHIEERDFVREPLRQCRALVSADSSIAQAHKEPTLITTRK